MFKYNMIFKSFSKLEVEIVYLPLELAEATSTIGNFDNEKNLVNNKYYSTTLNYPYNTFLVIT